jgi:3-oxoacyl-[acyl-carrier protein] reductase
MVLVASTAGQPGEAPHAHYAASKGGLIGLTRSLARELAPDRVRVNAVAPGWVRTEMTQAALDAACRDEVIPTGGPATPEQVAGPIAFLASEMASFVYGEVLSIDGGAAAG